MTRFCLALLIAALAPACAFGQCKQTVFNGSITSTESYSHLLSPDLWFRLGPMKGKRGWVISIGPKASVEDWTAPVTFPLTGERQFVGTGWGSTVEDKMKGPTAVEFVLTHSDYVLYSRLSNEALESPRPEAAGEFIEKVSKLEKGRLTLEVLSYGKGETKETVEWMNFKISVVVPVSFGSGNTSWSPTPCLVPRS